MTIARLPGGQITAISPLVFSRFDPVLPAARQLVGSFARNRSRLVRLAFGSAAVTV